MNEDVKEMEGKAVVSVELTPEELVVLKEVAKDRIAVSRIWGKTKNFALGVTAIIVGYLTIFENGMKWLKTHLGM